MPSPHHHKKAPKPKVKSHFSRVKEFFARRRVAAAQFEIAKKERIYFRTHRLDFHTRTLTDKLNAAVHNRGTLETVLGFKHQLVRYFRLSQAYRTVLHDSVRSFHEAKIKTPKVLNSELEKITKRLLEMNRAIHAAERYTRGH